MPQIVEPLVSIPDGWEPAPGRILWKRQQCSLMQEAGILTGRYELIEGEILSKMGQKPLHAYVVTCLNTWLVLLFGGPYVRIQLPILVPGKDRETSEPEPDAVVLAQSATAYLEENPGAEDVLLAVEVSDTTLRFDRDTKAKLYARSGIGEYWIVDLTGRRVLIHRQPDANGYADVVAYTAEEYVASLARPNAPILVSDLLPPIQE